MNGELRLPGPCWAVVPVKRLSAAKSRLAPTLNPAARVALQGAMLCDVLGALAQVPDLAGTVVVSTDPEVLRCARRHGAVALCDPARDRCMNAAVEAGLRHALAAGARMAAVIPADLPALDPAEVSAAIAATRASGAVHVVPDCRAEGTNALFLPHAGTAGTDLPDAGGNTGFGPHGFGAGSLARHLTADWPGPAAVALPLASLALDVDWPDDIARVLAGAGPTRARHTRTLCHALELGHTIPLGAEQTA